MKTDYLISILVPVYNVSKFIYQCASSLFDQTYDNIEYIFVNDCSTDDSKLILVTTLQKYPHRIANTAIINNSENKGVASSRNIALHAAHGKFICYVDADDWLEKNAIELLVQKQLETNADIVYANAWMHTPGGTTIISEPLYQTKHDMMLAYSRLTSGYRMVLWRRLIRKSLYIENDIRCIEGLNYAEDKLILSQLAYYCNSFTHLDIPIYHYNRLNEQSLVDQRKDHCTIAHLTQEIGNLQALENFFHTHNKTYFEENCRAKLRLLKELMNQSIGENNKKTFHYIVQQINNTDHTYYDTIGWKTNYKKKLYSSFLYMKYVPIVKRITKKLFTN